MREKPDPTRRVLQAGILAWILPGAGHFFLGHRGIAVVFFVAVSFAYGTGLAIGGVKTSVNPYLNRWLFLAELGVGGYTTLGYIASNTVAGISARTADAIIHKKPIRDLSPAEEKRLADRLFPYVSYYPESDVAQIYLAVGGLLNLLAILDALTRAQTGGLPVFYPGMPPEGDTRSEGEA